MKKHKKRNVVILCSVLVVLGLVAYLALSGNDNGDGFMQGNQRWYERGAEPKIAIYLLCCTRGR